MRGTFTNQLYTVVRCGLVAFFAWEVAYVVGRLAATTVLDRRHDSVLTVGHVEEPAVGGEPLAALALAEADLHVRVIVGLRNDLTNLAICGSGT